jgi:hypothetical protein
MSINYGLSEPGLSGIEGLTMFADFPSGIRIQYLGQRAHARE